MDSKLGLLNVWTQGDWVTKTVSLLLLAMSLASWIVILMKALDIWKYKKTGPEQRRLLAQRRPDHRPGAPGR